MGPRDGNTWTKIFEDGFNGRRWATDRLRAAQGQHTIVVPDVPGGDYILRGRPNPVIASYYC
jgi:lytic cellulose monooxygenase (C1-hydroxylating)